MCVCVVGEQRKMAELASRKGDDAAAKKAAFLREAEEAVRRAAQQDANRRNPVRPRPARAALFCCVWSVIGFVVF